MERRLAAILAADVVGYSRLIRADEEGTLIALKTLRGELIDPKIAEHNGRIVKLMGDGMLAEFGSVVDAVRAASEIQMSMAERATSLPADKRVIFRVGINLGDVIIDGDDILGDGVNIAARLEGIAEPGGICVSGKVYDEVRDRIDLPFQDMGEREVKNIDRPVRAWGWVAGNSAPPGGDASALEPPSTPDKPSIAVLPFDNMSGDSEQEYLADGITEDIITALSRFRWFFVIARNSTFTYKGQSPDIRAVADELGVRYVVEGSIRRAGDRIRVTAQLIDAATGNHIWADRFDRVIDDIFDLQEEIAHTIAAQVEPELAELERKRAARRPTSDLDAWACYHRGLWHIYRYTEEGSREGYGWLQKAVAADQEFAAALAAIAFARVIDSMRDPDGKDAYLNEALPAVRRAVSLDDRDPFAQHVYGRVLHLVGEDDLALEALETAVSFNPSFALGHHGLAYFWVWSKEPERAIPYCETAYRLSPRDPYLWAFHVIRSFAYSFMGEYERAIEWGNRAANQERSVFWTHVVPLSALGHLGKEAQAERMLRELQIRKPGLTCPAVKRFMFYARDAARIDRFLEGLAKAGLPEE